MQHVEEAEKLLQGAYDRDIGREMGVLDIEKLIDEIGPMNIHRVIEGVLELEELKYHVQTQPNSIFVTVLRCVRDSLVATGEYSEAALNKMYGLVGH